MGGNYKYPYIPKEYYPAVMLACKIIREDGTFNKAINSAVKYYRVDREELIHHVRARQGAGQKGKKREAYRYYAIGFFTAYDHYTNYTHKELTNRFVVLKATSEKNAEKQIYEKNDWWRGKTFAFIQYLKEFDTKEEAQRQLVEWKREVEEMNAPPTEEQKTETQEYFRRLSEIVEQKIRDRESR